MKRLKTMTCPRMVKWVVLETGLYVGLLVLSVAFLFGGLGAIVGVVGLVFVIPMMVVQYPSWRRVFLPVTIDGQGVRNRHCALKWEEIGRSELFEATFSTPARGMKDGFSVGGMGLMICLYRDADARALEFYTYAPCLDAMVSSDDDRKRERYPLNDRIFLPYTEKTVAMIRAHAPQLLQKEER